MSAWIEIRQNYEEATEHLSHSTWVRGLKSVVIGTEYNKGEVALYMSAWIEIVNSVILKPLFQVALYMSAWIEIHYATLITSAYSSRTLHECVDWNYKLINRHLVLGKVALYMSAWIEISLLGNI